MGTAGVQSSSTDPRCDDVAGRIPGELSTWRRLWVRWWWVVELDIGGTVRLLKGEGKRERERAAEKESRLVPWEDDAWWRWWWCEHSSKGYVAEDDADADANGCSCKDSTQCKAPFALLSSHTPAPGVRFLNFVFRVTNSPCLAQCWNWKPPVNCRLWYYLSFLVRKSGHYRFTMLLLPSLSKWCFVPIINRWWGH